MSYLYLFLDQDQASFCLPLSQLLSEELSSRSLLAQFTLLIKLTYSQECKKPNQVCESFWPCREVTGKLERRSDKVCAIHLYCWFGIKASLILGWLHFSVLKLWIFQNYVCSYFQEIQQSIWTFVLGVKWETYFRCDLWTEWTKLVYISSNEFKQQALKQDGVSACKLHSCVCSYCAGTYQERFQQMRVTAVLL